MRVFKNSDKENNPLNSKNDTVTNNLKARSKIGDEIRRKMKIKPNNNSDDVSQILSSKDLNINDSLRPNRLQNKKRNSQMQKSVQVQVSKSVRSVKSVKFDIKIDHLELKRKHSSSSILKNSKVVKKQRFSEKSLLNNSVCSNIYKDDQSTQNASLNRVTKQKYEKLYESLSKGSKKYNDQMFPQIWSSICRMPDPTFKNLQWVRISELFAGKFLTVWDYNESIKIVHGQFSRSQLLPICFNAIKGNNFMLQKLFQSQKYNPNGIYYVKINQGNTWKYIIIDDYIPVYKTENQKFKPAFLDVCIQNQNHMQIWPFLLQKAFAKYYSNYQCLDLGSEIDFLHEITGCYPQQIKVTQKNLSKISKQMNNYDSIMVAKGIDGVVYPLVPRKDALIYEDTLQNYKQKTYTNANFILNFTHVYCILLHRHFYNGSCTVKYITKPLNTTLNEPQISLRTLKIEQATTSTLTLSQKDQKHYYLGNYQYTFVRMIIAYKETDRSYRYICSAYSSKKYSSLSLFMQPGEYVIIIIPQWQDNKGYDMNLTFSANTKANIERKPYVGNEHILIQTATDLSQSRGKLKQINQNICTYSYIDYQLGFIIENINNERPNGQVKIQRSIEGLDCREIRPFNLEFRKGKTIEIVIESLNHYTVVLGVFGGLDRQFLQQFDFGS